MKFFHRLFGGHASRVETYGLAIGLLVLLGGGLATYNLSSAPSDTTSSTTTTAVVDTTTSSDPGVSTTTTAVVAPPTTGAAGGNQQSFSPTTTTVASPTTTVAQSYGAPIPTTQPPSTLVPNLVGMYVDPAKAQATQDGFILEIYLVCNGPQYPAGTIDTQSPVPGTSAVNDGISVWIERGNGYYTPFAADGSDGQVYGNPCSY